MGQVLIKDTDNISLKFPELVHYSWWGTFDEQIQKLLRSNHSLVIEFSNFDIKETISEALDFYTANAYNDNNQIKMLCVSKHFNDKPTREHYLTYSCWLKLIMDKYKTH